MPHVPEGLGSARTRDTKRACNIPEGDAVFESGSTQELMNKTGIKTIPGTDRIHSLNG